MNAPPAVMTAIAEFDGRSDVFNVDDVYYAISRAKGEAEIPDPFKDGYWAEASAFAFNTHEAANGGPWSTYFQPMWSKGSPDGSVTLEARPDIAVATSATIDYWASRSTQAKHPILVARYADLVWDFSKRVTGSPASIEFAHAAVDNYIAATLIEQVDGWFDDDHCLQRMLSLSISIGDSDRIVASVEGVIGYVERTAEDDKLGTYLALFDLLLRPKKGPPLTPEQEGRVIGRFERQFEEMMRPGGPYDVDPHSPQAIGIRLASYYQRKGDEERRKAVFAEIARAFERRSKAGDAMGGLIFLDDARQYFVEAGLPHEAERVQRESQELAPEATDQLTRHTVEVEIPDEDREGYLDLLTKDGIETGLEQWARFWVTNQKEIQEHQEQMKSEFPLQALFGATLIGDEGIKAKVDDTRNDPDGPMVRATAERMSLSTPWIAWGLDHLIANGLDAQRYMDFIAKSPVVPVGRLPLIRRGYEAHILGDYVQSIHLLIPQIERTLVELIYRTGGTSVKPFRSGSGRGVMQSKSLNDALDDAGVTKALGPDLRMYLVAALSHPKGHNIRNEVCHGLWNPEHFTKSASERVVHSMTAVSLLRSRPSETQSDS